MAQSIASLPHVRLNVVVMAGINDNIGSLSAIASFAATGRCEAVELHELLDMAKPKSPSQFPTLDFVRQILNDNGKRIGVGVGYDCFGTRLSYECFGVRFNLNRSPCSGSGCDACFEGRLPLLVDAMGGFSPGHRAAWSDVSIFQTDIQHLADSVIEKAHDPCRMKG